MTEKPIEAMTDFAVGNMLWAELAYGTNRWPDLMALGSRARQLARPADPTPPQTREEQARVLRTTFAMATGPRTIDDWLAVRDAAVQMFGRLLQSVDLEALIFVEVAARLDAARICLGDNTPLPLWHYYETEAQAALAAIKSCLAREGFRLTSSAPAHDGVAREDATVIASAAGESPAPISDHELGQMVKSLDSTCNSATQAPDDKQLPAILGAKFREAIERGEAMVQ